MESYRERMKRIRDPFSAWPFDVCDPNRPGGSDPHPEMLEILQSKMTVDEKIEELDSKIWSKDDLNWLVTNSKGKIKAWASKEIKS